MGKITCSLSEAQIENLYGNIYGHLTKDKSFDPSKYMKDLYDKILKKSDAATASKFLQQVPALLYTASARVDLTTLPENFDPKKVLELNKLFKDENKGLINVEKTFKITQDLDMLKDLNQIKAALENEIELTDETGEEFKSERFAAANVFTGTNIPFVKVDPNNSNILIPETTDTEKEIYINTLNSISDALKESKELDLFKYQGVTLTVKAQSLAGFIKNNEALLYGSTKEEIEESTKRVSLKATKQGVFQTKDRVILVLTDEFGENLFFDKDGNITTDKTNGKIIYQFLRAARKTKEGYTIRDIYNNEDQIKSPTDIATDIVIKSKGEIAFENVIDDVTKAQQSSFKLIFDLQNKLTANPNEAQFLPFLGITSGVSSEFTGTNIPIDNLLTLPDVERSILNTIDVITEPEGIFKKGNAYIVLNGNKFYVDRPRITQELATEIASVILNPNLDTDIKQTYLKQFIPNNISKSVKRHLISDKNIFYSYPETGLKGSSQKIDFNKPALEELSEAEIQEYKTLIEDTLNKGWNNSGTLLAVHSELLKNKKPFLKYNLDKGTFSQANYRNFIVSLNPVVRITNLDPGFYNKQIVFGKNNDEISKLIDAETETIEENLENSPGTVDEIKETHNALMERLKGGEYITGDIIFPPGSKTRFNFVESNGKTADAYNAKTNDITAIDEENFGAEIAAKRSSNEYLEVEATLKYVPEVNGYTDVIEVYVGDKKVGNIRVSTDAEFDAQKKLDAKVEDPSLDVQIDNNINAGQDPTNDDDIIFSDEWNRAGKYPDEKLAKEVIGNAEKWWKTSKAGKELQKYIKLKHAMNLVNSNVYAKFVIDGQTLLNPDNPDKLASILINPAKGSFVDVYHEAWHGFSQLFLTKQEKLDLYTEVQNYTDAKGNQPYKNIKKFREIEEILAEDFRSYAKQQSVKKGSPKRNTLFRRILNFLKKLFGVSTPSKLEVTLDIMNVPMVRELYQNLYYGNINNYEPNINNIKWTELDRGISNTSYPKYDALSPGDSQAVSRAIDNAIAEVMDDVYQDRKDAGMTSLKSTSLGLMLSPEKREFVYTRVKNKFQEKLDLERTKLDKIKNLPKLSEFKTVEQLKKNAAAVMINSKGQNKYVFLKSQIDDYNLLNADLKRGDRVKGEEWHSIKIVADFYSHAKFKNTDIMVVSKLEDAEIQYANYVKGRAKIYTGVEILNPKYDIQLSDEQEVIADNIRVLESAIKNWGNDSKGVVQYHQKYTDFEIAKKTFETDDVLDEEGNVIDENDPEVTHRDSSNLADEKNGKTKLQDLLGKETTFIIKTLFNVDNQGKFTYDRFGFKERADFRKVFTLIAKTIGGIQSRKEAYEKLQEAAKKFPELKQFVESKFPDPSNITNRFEAEISKGFWQDFSRPRIKYWNLVGFEVRDEKGKIESYDMQYVQSSIEIFAIMKNWSNAYNTSPQTKFITKTLDNKRQLNLKNIVKEFADKNGNLNVKKDVEFARSIGLYFDDVKAIKDSLEENRKEYGLPFIFKAVQKFNDIQNNLEDSSKVQIEYLNKFLFDPIGTLNSEIPKGVLGGDRSFNQKSQIKKLVELQAEYGYDSANLGVILPNGNLAYENMDKSALFEKVLALNSAKSLEDLFTRFPHMKYLDPRVNTYTKRLTLMNNLFPDGERNSNKSLDLTYFAGFKTENETGQTTTELDPLGKFLLEFTTMLQAGAAEMPRMSEKKSSYSIRLNGGISSFTRYGKTKGDDPYLYGDIPMFLKADEGSSYMIDAYMLNHIGAEFDRIMRFRGPKRNELLKISGYNRVIGKKNGKDVVEGDVFSAFDTVLKNETKRKLYELADEQLEEDIVDYINNNLDLYESISNDIKEYFTKQSAIHRDLFFNKIPYISKEILKKTNIPDLTIDKLLEQGKYDIFVDKLMQAYLYNDFVHKFETSILFMGDFAQWNHFKEDWSKRIPGVQSGGYSILTDKEWQAYMNTTELNKEKTYASIEGSRLKKDLNKYAFSETINTAVIKDAQRKSVYLKELEEAWREDYAKGPFSKSEIDAFIEQDKAAYEKMDESDGVALITFDAYRALSISGRKWSTAQEVLFQKIIKGQPYTPQEVSEAFPIRKYHYFGSLDAPIATTAMHKFSVMPIIPTMAKEGTELHKLHIKMMDENIQYVTFESGSKGAYLTKDGKVDNVFKENEKAVNEQMTFTPNTIYLDYLKEVTVINDKLKKEIPIATQTRFVLYDNLFDNGKLINEKNKSVVDNYNNNVKDLTELYKKELFDEIGFEYEDGKYTGNLEKFVQVIRNELDRRDTPLHIQKLIDTDLSGQLVRDLSLIPEADKIEKLVLAVVQNRIVRQKTKGEPMVQMASTLTNGIWDKGYSTLEDNADIQKLLGTNDLPFYRRGEVVNKKTGERKPTYLAKVAVPFNGDFVNLLKLKWEGKEIGTIDRLNELIKTDEFLAENSEAVTLLGPRIPNDALNTIEAFEVWHFVDPAVLNTVIVPTEIVAKAGSDFDGDKLFLTMPHIDAEGKALKGGPKNYEEFLAKYEELKKAEEEAKEEKKKKKKKETAEETAAVESVEEEVITPSAKKYLQDVKKYFQNRYISAAKDLITISENYAPLTKPNKTYLVDKYVPMLEEKSQDYDRFTNPHGIENLKNEKGQTRISPSTLLSAAYNLYKHDANLSLESALGIVAKVNKNHIMYKTVKGKMPLKYKKSYYDKSVGRYVEGKMEIPMVLRLDHNTIEVNGKEHISVSGLRTKKGSKITDVNSHNLNGILDRGKESWPFLLQLFPEAIGPINYLLQAGVSEEEVFLFVNQPLIQEYIAKQRTYKNAFANVLYPTLENKVNQQAKADVLSNIDEGVRINIAEEATKLKLNEYLKYVSTTGLKELKVTYLNNEGKKAYGSFSIDQIRKGNPLNFISISAYGIDSYQKINAENTLLSLLSANNYPYTAEYLSKKYLNDQITLKNLQDVFDINDNYSEKALAIFANFIEIEKQIDGLESFQMTSSYDTDKLSTVQQFAKRDKALKELRSLSKMDTEFMDQVTEQSIMKNFNNTDLILDIAGLVLPFRLNPVTVAYISSILNSSSRAIKSRFGSGVRGEEKFTVQFNNAILTYIYQNTMTYFTNENGNVVNYPENIDGKLVKVNNNIGSEINITDNVIEVNEALIREIYDKRSYAPNNKAVKDKNYTDQKLFTFKAGAENPFTNEALFFKYVIEREVLRKNNPIEEVKKKPMFKDILLDYPNETDAYERYLAEQALLKGFNPKYISGQTQLSYYDLVMKTVLKYPTITNAFPVVSQLKQAELKNKNLSLFEFTDAVNAKGVQAQVYADQLLQLADPSVSKVKDRLANQDITDVFKNFSEIIYFQHGAGKNRFGFSNILNAANFASNMEMASINFQNKIIDGDFSLLNNIYNHVMNREEFKNYTEEPKIEPEGFQDEDNIDDEGPTQPTVQSVGEIAIPTRNNKKESYKVTTNEGNVLEREGYKIKIPEFPNTQFYIYKDNQKNWQIDDLTTGLAFPIRNFYGNTINGALEEFTETVNKYAKKPGSLKVLQTTGLFVTTQPTQPTGAPVSNTNKPKGEEVVPGIYVNQAALTKEEQLELFDYLKPYLEEQAAKTNKGTQASKMIGLGLRWDYKSNNVGRTAINIPDVINPGNKNKYGYYDVSINDQPLGQITPRFRELMQKATGVDMTNYDGAIINLYEKDTFISSHNDVDESRSAIKYPVIGINLGGKGNFSIERIPGAGQLSLEAGTGYIFGVDGVNREVWHRTFPTPQDTFLPELTTKIDGKTYPAGSYRVTITMRRVMPLEPGMPTAPAKITTQPTKPIVQGVTTPKNRFTVEPKQAVDKKAKSKAKIATQYIGFAEGISGSSTALYAEQAGQYANTGNYSSNDVVFVSVPGKRGSAELQKQNQDRTIKEAIKAVEAGATVLTDNKAYIDSNSYNTGEKRLFANMQAKGYTYSEVTVDGQVIGTWSKPITQPTVQTVTAYRTSGTFSSKVDYAQRGSGAYYALDKPFQEIGSTDPVEQVDVVYDLSKTLDATTKEGQTKFMQIKRSAIEGKTFTSMKESNDAVRDAMIANGYNSLIGWIEEDVKDAGRELVIYEPTQSFVQESDRAENLNIFGLEGNNIPPTESCS